MIQKEVVAPNRVEWNALIERLEIFNTTAQYHQLLETIIVCIKIIEEGRWDCDDVKFFEGLSLLLDACKQLVGIVEEFFYSRRLGAIVLRLVGALRDQAVLSSQKIIMDFIEDCLAYTIDSLIPYKTLCNHECGSVEEFFSAHLPNPYHLLNEIHTDCLRMSQSNLERYMETAIVTRVVDYWRTLLNTGNESGDIQPLIELGEDLLSRIKECADSKRKKVLWKMVLLLQMLLRDHPAVRALRSREWSAEGFVNSLLPFECRSSSLAQQRFDKLPSTLLKDYRPQLQASRLIFEDAITGKTDVFEAQENHSRQVIMMLEEMVLATRKLLGTPPCEIMVCILGSTSRLDRRPYSDLEYMILHGEVLVDKKPDVDLYICHFISIFELMIVSLGETSSNHNNIKNGFKIDQSLLGLTVSFKSKSWGTPEEVIKKYVIELNEPPHSWLDKGFFEYLNPIALECPELGSKGLFEQYLKERDLYLKQVVSETDSPEEITQRFKIKEDWWSGLTRRQGIALASLSEMLHSVEGSYRDTKVGSKVNLKTRYYKPLLYCALSLGMYEGCQALTPSKTIKAYCASMLWGGEALLLWWQSALRFVVREQIKQHMRSGRQDDYMVMSEDECWGEFDLIVEGFILPLQNGVRECLSGSLPISMLGYVILKGYLNARRTWLEKWEGKGLKRALLLGHPLVQILSSYPDESGWSPQMELLLHAHYDGLGQLSTEAVTACRFAGLPVEGKRPRYLKENWVEECFKDGRFVGDPELSSERSQVKKVIVGDKSWYIKVKEGNKEGLMGREYLAMMLHLLLGGEPCVALGWPIKLTYADKGKAQSCYAWVSEGIGGESLGARMRNFPEDWKTLHLRRENFSQLFLFTYLTCPEDGQPENFKFIIESGKITLIAIDYGQCFVVADRREKRKERGDFFSSEVTVLTIKTLIYFFNAMNEPLSPDLITRIRLLDIDAWYLNWNSYLESINEIFKSLLGGDLSDVPKIDEDESNRLIAIPEGVLLCIKSRLALLQYWLRTTVKPITGQSILESLEPLVSSQYTFLKPIIKTPEDFYQNIDVKAYVKDLKSGKMMSSATWTTLQQQTLNPQQLARSCDLEPSYFRCVDFRCLTRDQQEFQLQLLEAVAQSKGKDFVKLDLSGSLIEEHRLILLLEKMPQLRLLDLNDCSRLGVMTLAKLLARRPNATVLSYNFDVLCPKLQAIRMTLDGNNFTMMLDLTIEHRRSLSKKMKDFVARYDRVVKSLYNQLSEDSSGPEVATALVELGKTDRRIIESLLKSQRYRGGLVRKAVSKVLVRICKTEEWVIELLLNGLKKYIKNGSNKSLMSDQDKLFSGNDVLNLTSEVLHNFARDRTIWTEDRTIDAVLGVVDIGNHVLGEQALDLLYYLGKRNGRAVEALIKVLRYPNLEVQINAARKLTSLEKTDNHMIDVWLSVLSNKLSDYVRIDAVEALGKLGQANARVINALMIALSDPKISTRLAVVEALVRLGRVDKRMMSALYRMLSSSETRLRLYAAQALARLGKADDPVIDLLWEGLSNLDDVLSVGAAQRLLYLGKKDERVIEVFRRALIDPECQYQIRRLAAEAMVHLGEVDDATVEVLVGALYNPTEKISRFREPLSYLYKIDDRILEALIVSLGSPNRRVRNEVMEVILGLKLEEEEEETKILETNISRIFQGLKQNNDRIIIALLSALIDSDWILRDLAVQFLALLPERLLLSLADLDLKTINPLEPKPKSDITVICTEFPFTKLGPYIVIIKGRLYAPHELVISDLISELKKDTKIKKRNSIIKAFETLCRLDERVMAGLLKEMDDPDEAVRQRVAGVIGQLGLVNAPIIEVLLKALSRSNDNVRQSVLNALVKLGGNGKEELNVALLEAMDDPDVAVRRWVAKVIVQSNSVIFRIIENITSCLRWGGFSSYENFWSELEGLSVRHKMIIKAVVRVMLNPDKAMHSIESAGFGELDKVDALVIKVVVKVMCNPEGPAPEIKLNAIAQLGEVGIHIIEALLRTYYDPENIDESIMHDLLRELSDLKSNRRMLVISALRRIGKLDDRVVDALLKLLIDPDSVVRESAVDALRELLSPKSCWNRIQHEIRQFSTVKPDFPEAPALQDVPELRLPSSVRPSPHSFNALFFRHRPLDKAKVSDEEVSEIDADTSMPIEEQIADPESPRTIEGEWVIVPSEENKSLK